VKWPTVFWFGSLGLYAADGTEKSENHKQGKIYKEKSIWSSRKISVTKLIV